jgi:predicted ATPase
LLLGNRLVTISGPGGIGKTRLAIEVGHQMMSQFPDGVWIIALEGLSSGSQVPPALAAVFGLREGPETAPVLDLSRNYFRSRKALLILDNCEHLLESCAALTKTLLEACPELRILVTSREVLGVSGEAQFPLPPLKTPGEGGHESLDVLSAYESIQLFADRAALARPGFALVAENVGPIGDICQKLDGIPLAIELAAARADALQVVEIRAGLGQYFSLLSSSERIPGPRQQSLRACLDWSWGLLAAHEGEFLRRLSIFVGGWTLEAAQAVCAGEGILPHAVRDLLTQLVRKSLLVVQEKDGRSRYRLLEPIRQYALEKLLETGETAQLHERHLDYLIQVAEQGYVELRGPDDLVWMKWLEAEQDNFRAALAWSLESLDADPQRALQLSGALQDFWDASGALKEGRGWLREALQKAPATPTLWRVRALNGDGLLCIRLGQEDAARPPLEAALAMARQLDDTTQLIISLLYYADTQRNPGEFRKYMAECLALARERDDRYHMAYAMGWDVFWFSADESVALRTLARALEIADGVGNARLRALLLWVYSGKLLLSGSYGLGISMAEEGLRLSELLGDKHTAAHCLLTLGRAASRQGRFEEAVGYEERSLRIFSDLSDTECHLRALFALAWCDFLTGDLDAAEEKTQECLSISRGLGTDYLFMTSRYLLALGQIATSRGDDREARGFLLEAFDSLDPKMDPVMLAEFLEGVCALPSLTPEGSARLLGKAGAIREAQGFVIPPSEQHLVNPVVERLQAQLSSEAYESARAAGAALTNEEAVQDAIEALQAMTGG